MKDIAARLGISQTTVSHVLTGKHEQFRISPGTVERVWKMAEKMRYRASALARSFRDRKSYSVTLAVEDLTNPFWTGVAIGAEREAEAHGYTLVVANTGKSLERERKAVQMLQERRVDGLILSPIRTSDPNLAAAHREGLPFIQIDRAISNLKAPCVRTDHTAGSALAVDYLVKRGRASIAYVGGPLKIPTFAQRLDGCVKTLARHGLKPAAVVHTDATPDVAQAAVAKILARDPRPNAIYAANIWATLGTLRAIHAAGLSVPQDLEIVGFDDIQDADLLRYPVTTVAQDVEGIGREAFRLLLKLMKGEKVPPRDTLLPPRLVARE
jgi:DNA-binding LacI/PurR family transcriptional regulator